MTPDELRPILTAYRKQVEQGWSKATAHPSYEGADGSPVGQCGVTSVWLQDRLWADHGVWTVYRVGMAWRLGDEDPLTSHCWLEVGRGWERVIIDLTAGQMEGLPDDAMFCETFQTLCSYEISYVATSRLSDAQLAEDPVRERLAILTKALS